MGGERDKDEDDWETHAFLKIKSKKTLRETPYKLPEIWEHDEVLKIVEYDPQYCIVFLCPIGDS